MSEAAMAQQTVAEPHATPMSRARADDLRARGEPFNWLLGGSLALGCAMIAGFLTLVLWNGLETFVPKPIVVMTDTAGQSWAGEESRQERYRPDPSVIATLPAPARDAIAAAGGFAWRTLLRIGNYDLYGEDFKWLADFEVRDLATPKDLVLMERMEWGPFIGYIAAVTADGIATSIESVRDPRFTQAHAAARARWQRQKAIERDDIGDINRRLEDLRLGLKAIELADGRESAAYRAASIDVEQATKALTEDYAVRAAEAQALSTRNKGFTATLKDIRGETKTIALADIVRAYPANDLGLLDSAVIYFARWWEFLGDEPREANTEGGVWPALFGTFAMTLLMVVAVAPFGVVTALYLREYARQGRLVAFVRICVNNLAGVPSIVYGVFGLGFFAYLVGGTIDSLFYPERLPAPTFGTGGLLWSSLTLALLTVPVVIVATEEALSAVPRSMREGSLACGASKWQTIKYVVLPRALPGILTGIILAMARGAGEVAPLMLVGVVKLAPALPIDGVFPFVHLERSFMHLGFHIYDVGFQSRNSEAGKPMVFVTTMLLIALVFGMNLAAIVIRTRLRRRFAVGAF
jgi:phosphate transport system permease protein